MNSAFDESYAGRCARFGCTARSFLLKYQIEEDIEKMVNEQVKLLNGNRDLYNMIDNDMINGDLDVFFIKEYNAIYAWREEFFYQHFPNGSWFTVDFANDSIPFDPEDEYLRFITIPYQITRYFDRVMALASVKVSAELSWLKQQIYLENNEYLSNKAESKYKWEALVNDLSNVDDKFKKLAICEEVNVGFSEVSHIIAEVYKTGPNKLEEMALKAILVYFITREDSPLSHVPFGIQMKFIHGMYAINNDAPDNISSEGKEMFETMKRVFGLTL